MTQPPHDPRYPPQPGQQPWQEPGPGDPHGGQPPPYQGAYGQAPQADPPGYPGGPGGYTDPAQGLAGRGARLVAAIIDWLLLGVLTGLLSLPFVDWNERRSLDTGEMDWQYKGQLAASLIGIALAFLYFWLMHAKSGQTIGKKLLRIRVVRTHDRAAITSGQAAGRSAFYTIVGGISGCIGLINALWCLWDDRRQCLHDKVAKTVVAKVHPGEPDPYKRR
jgi:uncharacterized RDD family membrane protein YckC